MITLCVAKSKLRGLNGGEGRGVTGLDRPAGRYEAEHSQPAVRTHRGVAPTPLFSQTGSIGGIYGSLWSCNYRRIRHASKSGVQ